MRSQVNLRLCLIFVVLLAPNICTSGALGDESEELHGIITESNAPLGAIHEKPLKQSHTTQSNYDEEEFVGFEPRPQAKSIEHEEEKITEKVAVPEEQLLPPPKTNYYLEMVYVSFIAVYIINFFVGKRKNDQIATAWASAVSKPLQSNFSKVGEGKNIGIVKESQYRYILKATGRVNTIGLQATLELRKRHDLFSIVLELFWPQEDTLTIDVLMDENAMDTFVFALLRKKEEKKYRKNAEDVASFTGGSVGVNALPASLCVASECEELISSFLTTEVVATITKFEQLFRRIHFSDQGLASATHKKSLQFVFKVPDNEAQLEGIVVFTRMVFYFIDLVARVNLSKQGKQKAMNHRSKVAEKANKLSHEQRQEAAQQRKLEKLQKEKEKIASMSPEAAAKFEEKLKKKEMRRRMPKMKVTMN